MVNMANISTELGFILFMSSFLAILGYFMSLLPSTMQFINTFDFLILGGGFIGVAGTCAIVTGIPCAGALIVFGLINVYQYIIVTNSLIKLIIFTPIIIGLVYVVSRLARGGG